MKCQYTVVLLPEPPEEGGYTVVVPALPGCVTQAETVDEALAMAKEVIELYVAEAQERNNYIPVETGRPTVTSVEVDVPDEAETAEPAA